MFATVKLWGIQDFYIHACISHLIVNNSALLHCTQKFSWHWGKTCETLLKKIHLFQRIWQCLQYALHNWISYWLKKLWYVEVKSRKLHPYAQNNFFLFLYIILCSTYLCFVFLYHFLPILSWLLCISAKSIVNNPLMLLEKCTLKSFINY